MKVEGTNCDILYKQFIGPRTEHAGSRIAGEYHTLLLITIFLLKHCVVCHTFSVKKILQSLSTRARYTIFYQVCLLTPRRAISPVHTISRNWLNRITLCKPWEGEKRRCSYVYQKNTKNNVHWYIVIFTSSFSNGVWRLLRVWFRYN